MAGKTFDHECLEDTISFAESLGFDGDWDDSCADAHEDAAIEYIESLGYTVRYKEDE